VVLCGIATGVVSSPAMGADGSVYVGSSDNKLYAFDSSDSRLWTYSAAGAVDSSPSIGSDGRLYVGSNDNNLYVLAEPTLTPTPTNTPTPVPTHVWTLDEVADSGNTTDQSIEIGDSIQLGTVTEIKNESGRAELWVNGQKRAMF
jgi:outer membrane protein assembly factor BamB